MISLRLLFCVSMTVLVSGCGLKGDLYSPAERAQEVSPQAQQSPQSTEQQKKQRSSSQPAGEAQTPAVPTDTTREQSTPTTEPPGN